ncbi:hypothetical protein ACRB80_01870 [Thermoanaerobacter mathranii]
MDYPYQIGSAQALNGQATIWCNPLTIIYRTNPFRYVIARDIGGLQSSPIRIAVYFYVYGSKNFTQIVMEHFLTEHKQYVYQMVYT